MPECENCGAYVSDSYRRVFQPTSREAETVAACPHCEDKVRAGDGRVRDSRAPGNGD